VDKKHEEKDGEAKRIYAGGGGGGERGDQQRSTKRVLGARVLSRQ